MRFVFFLLYNVIFFIIPTLNAYALINDGLIAYYAFEQNIYDYSGNNNSGTLVGNAGFKEGKVGYALYLDGDGDYVDLGNGLNLGDACSVTAWVKSEDLSRKYPAILAKYETNGYGPYDFDLHYNKVNFWISDGQGSYDGIDSNNSISKNTWVHVAWIISNNKLRIYINGNLDIEKNIPSMTQNSDKVTIGRQALMFSPYSDLQFKGYIDELRVYDRELSVSEVAEIYGESSPGYVSFDYTTTKGVHGDDMFVGDAKSFVPEMSVHNIEAYLSSLIYNRSEREIGKKFWLFVKSSGFDQILNWGS